MPAMPTEGMREEARRYRAWKEEGYKGGTDVAARRASQILSGDELSDDTIVTMSAWFARHEVDKKAEGFSSGEDGYPSPGRVAWAAWGGDAGKSWADALVERMDRAMVTGDGDRPYPNEHAARLRDPDQYDEFRRRNDGGGDGVDFIFGIKEGEDGAELQAIRFRLSKFTAAEARAWLDDRDYEVMEFEEATNDRAKPDELKVGDFVSWNSSGGRARGKIERIVRDGSIDVPDSSFSIEGGENDPAALIRVYRQGDDGWQGTDTRVGHKFSTLTKIEALREMEEVNVRDLEGAKFKRVETTKFNMLDERTIEFPFSSEYPVARYFGNEVLSHEMEAANLERLNDGAPLLFNHDPDRIIGVVERAWINGEKKRGYVNVRFSRNKQAQEVLADVRDGILRGVSFGYSIDKMEERENDFVATRWSPFEVSVVSIPADPTVGVGRSLDDSETEQAAPAASPANTMTEPVMDNTPDLEVIRSEAVEAERNRATTISQIGERHKLPELARELIDGGKSIDEARAAFLEKIGKQPVEHRIDANDVGLSDKETRRFSFVRALNYLANQGDAQARREAEFEIEVGKAAAQKYERSSNGIVVPNEVLRRDLVVGTPSAGGNLVEDQLLAGSFIDLLRNRLALAQAGVTMLTGLQGNISIPRQTSASTAYWVGENSSPTESQQAIDQVNMTPKTVGAFVDYSRRLLLQSSIDVEGMIRNDLTRVIALEIDRVGVYGTGSSNQPQGLTLTTGIGSGVSLSTFGTFDEYIAMETEVAAANADAGSLRYIINASARGALKSTEKASNTAQFVFENNEINGYPVIVSNQLQGNDALFGDFSMMVMGMWSGLDLTVDPFAGATAGTVRVIALQDIDLAVKQPASFSFAS
jgi:HK97 family phage major capsid protein/HK97 family phage prohead protease